MMRALTILRKLKDAAFVLPDLLYYTDEAVFAKRIRSCDIDKAVLSARIRHKAHVMEQDIYIVDKPRFRFICSSNRIHVADGSESEIGCLLD